MKYIIFSVLFFLCSCVTNTNRPTTDHADLIEFDIPDVIQQEVEPTVLSGYAHSCSYIPLELTNESVIQQIRQVYTTSHEIITVDWYSCLLFDKQSGKFIRKIGTNGTGINEYLNIISSAFDEKNEIVYILSTGNQALIGYNLKGEVIHYVPRHNKYLLYIGLIDSVTYAGTIPNNSGKEKNRLLIGSFQEETTRIVPNHSFFTKKKNKVRGSTATVTSSYYNFGAQLYQFNRQLYMKEAWNDTVFHIQKPGILTPKYVFNLGSLKIPEHVRGDDNQIQSLLETQCIEQINPLEMDDYLFFNFWYKGISYACIYDKDKKCLTLADKQENGFSGMQNDIQGGISFWPRYISQKGEMLKWINADVFCEYQKKQGIEILPNLQEEDNPVVMIVN